MVLRNGSTAMGILVLLMLTGSAEPFSVTQKPLSLRKSTTMCFSPSSAKGVMQTVAQEGSGSSPDKRSRRSALLLVPAVLAGLAGKACAAGTIPMKVDMQGSGVLLSAPPTDEQTAVIKRAFRAFDAKDLQAAEKGFSEGIAIWEELKRPRDEMAELCVTL